jgi:FKBP-type peptidyl-prolyl cis-trans isomerase FkpA
MHSTRARRPAFYLAALLAAVAPFTSFAAEPAMDEAARMQYALGYQIGKDIASMEPRPQDLARGVEDGRAGAKPRLSEEEMNAALGLLETRLGEQRAKEQAAAADKALVDGKAYLAANAQKSGVTTTASGLQYRVVTAGSGPRPKAQDTVTVNYRGTLVDGTEFDSSYKRGEPASFPLSGVIPGWTEGVQLMPVGSKYEFVLPPDLAYGARGPLANQVLLFEVELLGIAKPDEAAK